MLTDCEAAVKGLINSMRVDKRIRSIIEDIRKVTSFMPFFCCQKFDREQFMEAHKLAMEGEKPFSFLSLFSFCPLPNKNIYFLLAKVVKFSFTEHVLHPSTFKSYE